MCLIRAFLCYIFLMGQIWKKHKIELVLWLGICLYILYFSLLTVYRHQNLHSSYYDLGIMHQTVYNSYKAVSTGDFSRFLEITNPHGGGEQVKRMAIHNDLLLAFFVPFYFIHSGPETLLILQTIILALGALAVFNIAKHVLRENIHRDYLAFAFSIAYLLYPPMQRSNIFDFHAVVIATSTLLWMYYFWITKKYTLSFLFFIISLFTKENIGLTTMLFGMFILFEKYIGTFNNVFLILQKKVRRPKIVKDIDTKFAFLIVLTSIIWFVLSFAVIIPLARGGGHFATERYSNLTENPITLFTNIFNIDTFRYLWFLLGPLLFLSFISPLHLFIVSPEFAINLLSSEWNMRNIVFHYTAVIQPFVFISAIHGIDKVKNSKFKIQNYKTLGTLILLSSFLFSFFKAPLPYSLEKDMGAWKARGNKEDVMYWLNILKDENIKVSATGHEGAHFSSRRYFYNFSEDYRLADYVVINIDEAMNGFQKDMMKPAYDKLQRDPNYMRVYNKNGLEVYKKL